VKPVRFMRCLQLNDLLTATTMLGVVQRAQLAMLHRPIIVTQEAGHMSMARVVRCFAGFPHGPGGNLVDFRTARGESSPPGIAGKTSRLDYVAEGNRRMSEATTSGTGSFPKSQSRTSVGHTPSFSASRAFPHAMRRISRFSCAGVNIPPIVERMLSRQEV